MTSQRQRETNRRNARASSGPRTAAGKGRSSQNALRHGLAVPVSQHPALVQEATVRAVEIARAVGDRRSHADALILGEAELELSRLRMVQQDLLSRAFAALAETGAAVSGGRPADLTAIIQELRALERYERRALSRQKTRFAA